MIVSYKRIFSSLFRSKYSAESMECQSLERAKYLLCTFLLFICDIFWQKALSWPWSSFVIMITIIASWWGWYGTDCSRCSAGCPRSVCSWHCPPPPPVHQGWSSSSCNNWITLFFFCEQSFGILKTHRLWKLSPQYSHFRPCLNIPNNISPQKLKVDFLFSVLQLFGNRNCKTSQELQNCPI